MSGRTPFGLGKESKGPGKAGRSTQPRYRYICSNSTNHSGEGIPRLYYAGSRATELPADSTAGAELFVAAGAVIDLTAGKARRP